MVYNILAKVLGNQLKSVLSKFISQNQSTLVLLLSILYSVVVAFGMIHFMKNRRKGKSGSVALKIDISKGYD